MTFEREYDINILKQIELKVLALKSLQSKGVILTAVEIDYIKVYEKKLTSFLTKQKETTRTK